MKNRLFLILSILCFSLTNAQNSVNFEAIKQSLGKQYTISEAKKYDENAPVVIVLTEEHSKEDRQKIRKKITNIEASSFFDIEVLGLENIIKQRKYDSRLETVFDAITKLDTTNIIEPLKASVNEGYKYSGPEYTDYLNDKRFKAQGLEEETLYISASGFAILQSTLDLYLSCALGENISAQHCSIVELTENKDGSLEWKSDFPIYARMMKAYDAINFYAEQYGVIQGIPEALTLDFTRISTESVYTFDFDGTSISAHYIGLKDRDYITQLAMNLSYVWAMDNIIIPRNKAMAYNMAELIKTNKASMGALVIGDAHVDANYGLGLQQTSNPEEKTVQAYLNENGVSYIVIRREN